MIQIQALHKIFLKYPLVSTDSRNVKQNSIFFALKGVSFNGNKFAAKALAAGAKYAIIDELEYYIDERTILVNDVLAALQQLARYHRNQFAIPVVAITGTNGKTTTKELIAAVLKQKYSIIATEGNFNNHIGVPLTLLNINKHTQIAIIEMGANHIGEISLLCEIALPNAGMICNIGKAHLEGFGSFEGVVRAKSELYDYLKLNEGSIVCNADDELLVGLLKSHVYKGYGADASCLVSGEIVSADPRLKLKLKIEKEHIEVQTQLAGAYNLNNILAAVTFGHHFEVGVDKMRTALEEYTPNNNRSQIIQAGSNSIILDAYNANPSSMYAAILNFSQLTGDSKVLILGDMLELGEYADEEHLKIIRLIEELSFQRVVLVGPAFGKVNKNSSIQVFNKVELAVDYLQKADMQNSLILIKGSRGIKLEKTLDCF